MYSFSLIEDESVWATLPIVHWQHSWEYGVIQQQSHRTVTRVIVTNSDKEVVGYFQAVTYPLFRKRTITYLPYGPVFLTSPPPLLLQKLHTWLRSYGTKHNSIVVRGELPESAHGFYQLPLFAYRSSFHQPRGEAVMDLNSRYEYLAGQYSKSTKRNLKKAQSHNLQTAFYHGQDMLSQLDAFVLLNEQNTREHQTTTHPREYFESLFAILSKNSNNFIATVSDSSNILAVNIFTVFHNQAHCPFGASNTDGKQKGAYYWIKQESIKHLQDMGISEFNWGGIAVGKNDDRLRGLNQFKLGWGTTEKHHADFYDVVLSPFYWLYLLRSFIKR